MANQLNKKSTYSIGELINEVNKQYEGLFEIPDSELTIGDDRFFNLLEIKYKENENVLVLSSLEQEQDYFVVGPDEVKWTDNWSGEDERIYRGNVQDEFQISFEEEIFQVNANDLEFSKKRTSPVFEIDMDTPNKHTNRSNSHGLER